ncbi:3-phosphoshikimate 1-carboxyvinyltransferase, partial [Clostridium saudiense]|nr:3-phosphoshikimate 1-carboxyvinyltransferase [Clostridium saudiense]
GYIDLTLSAMKDFGVNIINNNYKEFIIKGNQKYFSRKYRVEGDYSQGAFFLCANALGNNIEVQDLSLNSLQGDKEVVDILERMGSNFINSKNGIKNEINNGITSTIIDGSQCPDIIPVLAATASLAKGRT